MTRSEVRFPGVVLVRLFVVLTLAAFVAFFAAPRDLRDAAFATSVALGFITAAVIGAWMVLDTPTAPAVGVVGIVCSLGFSGSQLYLRSLGDGPEIPIGGFGVLLLSVLGLVVLPLVARDRQPQLQQTPRT